MKTKTTAVAAIAALAVPGAALADKTDHAKERSSHGTQTSQAAKSKAKKAKKGKAFVVKGVDFGGAQVSGGALAGTLTLDPTSASKHARKALELDKAKLAGEDTVTFGEAGDEVRIKFVGLTATDALQPADVVKVIGKVRGGEIDIRKITVKRPGTETETPEAQKQS